MLTTQPPCLCSIALIIFEIPDATFQLPDYTEDEEYVILTGEYHYNSRPSQFEKHKILSSLWIGDLHWTLLGEFYSAPWRPNPPTTSAEDGSYTSTSPHILMAWCLCYKHTETLLCLYLTGVIKGLQKTWIEFQHRDTSVKFRHSVLNCIRKTWKDLVLPQHVTHINHLSSLFVATGYVLTLLTRAKFSGGFNRVFTSSVFSKTRRKSAKEH
jgi:hypothetical protein